MLRIVVSAVEEMHLFIDNFKQYYKDLLHDTLHDTLHVDDTVELRHPTHLHSTQCRHHALSLKPFATCRSGYARAGPAPRRSPLAAPVWQGHSAPSSSSSP
eukprot:COSAG02_NODE_27690_length_604_cov_1.465347_2_plen_100_part_01